MGAVLGGATGGGGIEQERVHDQRLGGGTIPREVGLQLTRADARELRARAGDLDGRGQPWRQPYREEPTTFPAVVQDRRRGQVCVKMKTDEGGPAWLHRGGAG